ncbi:CLUMA_CG011762, isoform A [Clunio marinus]|uniref:CLUMA_CG011762, isoform A n=1 Tax=Clunio marinus TaxID=568069 RepID=A0A1J1IDV8_9DIPT|nr:CLUMA_CG011762, isoform A [Clunio marinus]
MNKLKAVARSVSFSTKSSTTNKYNRTEKDKLEPVVGFQLTLHDAANDNTQVPQLDVHLIGARHLPSNFGLKTVEGYIVKVKLFPGSTKFDSSIQTSSWPRFNENFSFPMAPMHKSSLKSKQREYNRDVNGNISLPEKLFKGTFVVFTVIALLELPSGSYTGIKGTYKSLKRQGSLIIRDRAPKLISSFTLNPTKESTDKNKNHSKLTQSETQRNIGSVTFFLDAKLFEENSRNKSYSTTEMWMPIRDITVAPNAKLSVNSSPKGQVEMILELCDHSLESTTEFETNDEPSRYNKSLNPFECDDEASTSRSRFSLTDVKFPNMKRLMKSKREKQTNGLCLKITTSKMRCSIKVKEEFENDATQIYVKTTVFEHDILSGYWRSNTFSPTLSIRWDQIESTVTIPLTNEEGIEHVSIKTTIATKTKMGKKIVLGTIYIRPDLDNCNEQWTTMLTSRNTPIPMWYSFE